MGHSDALKVPQRQILIYIWQRDRIKIRSSHRCLIYRLLPQELPLAMQSLLLQLLLLLEVAAPGVEALVPAAPLDIHAVAEEGVQLPQLLDPLVLGVLVERLVLLCM